MHLIAKASLTSLTALGLTLSLAACDTVKDSQETLQDGAGAAVGQINKSQVLSDLTQVTAAIQGYYVQNNKYPAQIGDLQLKLYHPSDLSYDAATGKVRSKTYPDL